MSTALKAGAAFVLDAVLGGGGGLFGGFKLGTTAIISNWATAEANSTDHIVGALEQLRAKKTTEAAATLEDHLDRHVFGLMPTTREGIALPEPTLKQIRDATTRARDYRKANPRAAGNSPRAKDVDTYLSGE
jgi:hypothetical protein